MTEDEIQRYAALRVPLALAAAVAVALFAPSQWLPLVAVPFAYFAWMAVKIPRARKQARADRAEAVRDAAWQNRNRRYL